MKNFLSLIILLLFAFNVSGQKMQSLGAPINTPHFSEFAPTISADGKLLIFESDKDGRWALYSSRQEKPGEWTEPEALDAINNTIAPKDFLGGPCLSYDGTTLFFTSDRKGGVGGIDIWYSKLENGEWSEPINAGKPVNTPGYEGFPSLSPDGKKLYFMKPNGRRGPTGQHCCEIYVAEKRGKSYVNPKPLPFPVNTGCEAYPRIMADGRSLIFSSMRVGGYGGYDLFMSRYSNGDWSMPEPMKFLNTPKDDELVTVPASGATIYFSSTATNYKESIFFLPIPPSLRPDEVKSVDGVVRSAETDKPIRGRIKIVSRNDENEVYELEGNAETGTFKAFLKDNETYDVSVSAKGYAFESKVFELQDEKYFTEEQVIKLHPLKMNASFTLNNILFAYDSDSLSPESYLELERVITLLKNNPLLVLEISAHTDNRGSDAYNNKLSQSRAESVVAYLVAKGINPERLVAKGYGKQKPAVKNDSEENRAKNRRVEFKVLKI